MTRAEAAEIVRDHGKALKGISFRSSAFEMAADALEAVERLEAERAQWKRQGAEEELRRLAGIMRDTELVEEYSNQLVKWLVERADEIKARREATDEAD